MPIISALRRYGGRKIRNRVNKEKYRKVNSSEMSKIKRKEHFQNYRVRLVFPSY